MVTWGTTPRRSVLAEAQRRGTAAVALRCAEILSGERVDPAFLLVLAGPAARPVTEGREGGLDGHWPRVWAARGLLYAWDDRARPAVLGAADDGSWRVREMVARVVAAHGLEAFEVLDRLAADPVPRVRAAAARARERLAAR